MLENTKCQLTMITRAQLVSTAWPRHARRIVFVGPPLLPCCALAFFVGVRSAHVIISRFLTTPQREGDRYRWEQPVALVLVCRRQRCLGGVLGCPSGRRTRDGRHLAHDHRQDWYGGNELEAGGRHRSGVSVSFDAIRARDQPVLLLS